MIEKLVDVDDGPFADTVIKESLERWAEPAAWPWAGGEIVPLWHLCKTTTPPLEIFAGLVDSAKLTDSTLDALLTPVGAGEQQQLISIASATELEPDTAFVEAAQGLGSRATALARLLLPSLPSLCFELLHPEDWARGRRPRWIGLDKATGVGMPLGDLGGPLLGGRLSVSRLPYAKTG